MNNDFIVRPYRRGEEQKMATLVNLCRAEHDDILVTADLIREEWDDPRLELDRDTRVALNAAEEYIAVAEVWFEHSDAAGEAIRHIGFTMHPAYREAHADLMQRLFDSAIEHAMSHPQSGAGGDFHLRTWASANDVWKRKWVLDHGFDYVHCGLTMLYAPLDELPPVPALDGVRIEGWRRARDHDLWQTFNRCCQADDPTFVPLPWDEWRELYHSSTQVDPTLWRLAVETATERVVGFALTEIIDIAPDVGDPQEGWIADLGMLPAWKGQGLRRALIVSALHTLHEAGVNAVLIGVDSTDVHDPSELYESIGFRVLRGSCTFHKRLGGEGSE